MPIQLALPHWNVLWVGSALIREWDIGQIVVPCWRLYWSDQKGAWIRHRGSRYEIGPNRLIMIAAYSPLQSRAERPARHFWIHFSATAPYDLVNDWVGELPLPAAVQREVRALARDLRAGGTNLSFAARLTSLIARGMSCVPEARLNAVHLDPRVASALKRMRTDPGATVAGLAAAVHLAPRSLARLFDRELGQSPKRMLLRLRLEQAETQLVYTENTIERIARDCGFRDRYHFSAVFSRTHGMGPATFRKRAHCISERSVGRHGDR